MSAKNLQIRRLPEDVYEGLAFRAERQGRSLAQQAVADLRRVGEAEGGASARRAVVERVLADLAAGVAAPLAPAPEEVVRQDRER